jgi:ribonuclease VapC
MIVDSSAIVAVVLREPDHEALLRKMGQARTVAVPAPIVFEAAMVLTIKLGGDGLARVHEFLREVGASTMPFTDQHASAAFEAYYRYGKGRHPAALNFGDCLSYAAAKVSGHPLLFVGKDFPKTDIAAA